MMKTNARLLSAAALLVLSLIVLALGGALDFVLPGAGQEKSPKAILEHRYPVHCLAFSPDGKTLATGGGINELAGEVRLYDVATGTARAILRGNQYLIHSLRFTPDGRRLVSVSHDRALKLWEVATGRECASLTISPEYRTLPVILPIAFSPASQTLAVAGSEPSVVMLYRLTAGQERAGTPASVPFGFIPDGRGIAFWRPAPESAVAPVDLRRLNPAGEVGGWPPLEMWDVSIGQQTFTLRGHTKRIAALAFSGDGRTLASASFDRTVKLWDVGTGRQRVTLWGHTDQVHGVAFTSDGKLLASASHDRTVRLWDTATGLEQAIYRGHTGAVTCVAFSPDGQWLASGSSDKTVRLWSVGKDR